MLAWAFVVGALFAASPTATDSHLLDVPYRNQLDGSVYAWANCGPTSLSMVLAYYGVDASTWDLRVRAMKAQHSWVSDDGGYSDSYGVFVYNLATVAEGLGMHVDGLWAREGGRIDRLHQWQPTDLRRAIQADHPVIVEVEYRALPMHSALTAVDDHYIVVHGTVDGDFVYSDPFGAGSGGADLPISEHDLMVAMSQASTPRAGFALSKSKS
jgi:uncharacterized protein YvpB